MVKYSISDLKKFAKETFNGNCLSSEYVSINVKHKWQCKEGHIWNATWGNILKGAGCPDCYGNRKYTFEEVKTYIESKDYKLLSNEYVNSSSKLILVCPKGHEINANFHEFKIKPRCAECAGLKKKDITYVKSFYEAKGFTLLSTEYINSKQKLDLICNKGHKYSTSFAVSTKGFGCPECSGNRKFSFEEVQEYFNSQGYSLVSKEYKNKNSKLETLCPKGHQYFTTMDYFKNGGHRCKFCHYDSIKIDNRD